MRVLFLTDPLPAPDVSEWAGQVVDVAEVEVRVAAEHGAHPAQALEVVGQVVVVDAHHPVGIP